MSSSFEPPTRLKDNPLFKPDFNSSMNAAVGLNGGVYDFSAYGHGFFEAGFSAIETSRTGRVPVDVLIYPIVYCFRHGLELYTKHFLAEINYHIRTIPTYKPGHGLEENWMSFVIAARESSFDEFNSNQVTQAGLAVNHFCDIDPNGQFFRYPESIKGEKHLTDVALINVNILEKGMRVVFEVFQDWCRYLDIRRGC